MPDARIIPALLPEPTLVENQRLRDVMFTAQFTPNFEAIFIKVLNEIAARRAAATRAGMLEMAERMEAQCLFLALPGGINISPMEFANVALATHDAACAEKEGRENA